MNIKLACLLAAAVALSACGTDAPRKSPARSPESDPPSAVLSPAPQGAESAPQRTGNPYADPRLDPIRDKVPLVVRANAVSAAHTSLDRRPRPEEKRAIRLWLEIRESQQGAAPPPSPQLAQTRVRVTRAITQLYAGQFTYAEFGRRLRQIDAQHQAASRPRLGQR